MAWFTQITINHQGPGKPPRPYKKTIMYQVLYYPKNESCQIIKGFPTREKAWAWVQANFENIDWYKIEKQP